MKIKVIQILNLILAIVISFFVVSYTFAWFSNSRSEETQFGAGSAGAYFAGGDGSYGDPFIIDRAQHLYNLSWLQNMGKFVDNKGKQTKYYFAMSDDVDLVVNGTPIILPPIGNDEYPFIGEFDGRGHNISNAIISTNRNVLTGIPAALDKSATTVDSSGNKRYKFSNSVGFFGMTGEGSSISDFILKNPVIDLVDNLEYNSICDSAATPSASSSPKTAGIAVGYVNGGVSSIGISGGALAVRRTSYTTVNSIIGSANPNIKFDLTGGEAGGDGNSYGSSFNVGGMLERLYTIYKNQYGTDYVKNGTMTAASTYSPYLPTISTQNTYPALDAGEKMAFSVDASQSTYSGNTAKEVVSDLNVGYFLGNQNKITNKTLTFGDKLYEEYGQYYTQKTVNNNQTAYVTPDSSGIVPRWFYENTYEPQSGNKYNTSNRSYTSGGGFKALTQEKFDSLPQNIKDLLPDDNTSKTFTTIRLSQQWNYTNYGHNYGTTDNYSWSYHGQISYMGKTYGEDTLDSNGKPIANNADTRGIALPNNGIWFKPATVGVFRFIMYADSPGQGFALIKINRTNSTDENPFNVDTSLNGQDCLTHRVIYHEMPSNVLLYFEYDTTDDFAENKEVEYLLLSSGSGAYFVYLDIGAGGSSGDGESNGNGDGDGEKQADVSGVDFVGDGVTLESDGSGAYTFSALYSATETMIVFTNNNAAITLYFHRTDSDDTTIAVKYYTTGTNSPSASVAKRADISTTKNNFTVEKIGVVGGYNWN
jgi:hypothetical protein